MEGLVQAETERLRAYYERLPEEELLTIGSQFTTLTGEAQAAICAEFERRGMPGPGVEQDEAPEIQPPMRGGRQLLHPNLAPLLNVRDGAKAVEFYKTAFGATVLMQTPSETGSVVAHLSVNGAEFWLADESTDNQNYSPDTLSGSTARMILTVADPDAVFDRAVEAGASIVWPVADQPYLWRIGRVEDPFGHHWEIGKPLVGG